MIINASIQVVPLIKIEEAFPIIDSAIELIQQSGLKYLVGAFETTIQGEYEPVQALIKKLQDYCYEQEKTQFLIYTKLHLCGGKNILIENKVQKFRQDSDFVL